MKCYRVIVNVLICCVFTAVSAFLSPVKIFADDDISSIEIGDLTIQNQAVYVYPNGWSYGDYGTENPREGHEYVLVKLSVINQSDFIYYIDDHCITAYADDVPILRTDSNLYYQTRSMRDWEVYGNRTNNEIRFCFDMPKEWKKLEIYYNTFESGKILLTVYNVVKDEPEAESPYYQELKTGVFTRVDHISKEYTKLEEQKPCAVLKTADGIEISVVGMRQSRGNIYRYHAKTGYIYVVFDIVIENGSERYMDPSSFSFQAYFDDYGAEGSFYAVKTFENSAQGVGVIAPGQKARDVLGYEVPEGWTTAELQMNNFILAIIYNDHVIT